MPQKSHRLTSDQDWLYSDDARGTIDIIQNLLGSRTVAYKVVLAHLFGTANAGLLLSQFLYWSEVLVDMEEAGRSAGRNGWFWKTQDQIWEETGLSRREQETARRDLRDTGVLEESKRGLPAKLYFRVNIKALIELMSRTIDAEEVEAMHRAEAQKRQAAQDVQNAQARMAESAILVSRNPPSKDGGNAQTLTDNTSKSTSKTKQQPLAPHKSSQPTDVVVASALLLIEQGVTRVVAQELAMQHSPAAIECQIAYLPYRQPKDPAATLVKAIQQAWAAPAAYRTAQAAMTQREQGQKRTEKQKQEKVREEQEKADAAKQYEAIWESLSQAEQESIEAEIEARLRREHPTIAKRNANGPLAKPHREGYRREILIARQTKETGPSDT